MRLISISFIVFCFGFQVLGQTGSSTKAGILDLRNWNPEQQPVVSLDAKWEFYWMKLLTWDELKPEKAGFIEFSTPWNEQNIGGNDTLPKAGYATYALEVWIPPGLDSISFEVPAVFNSHAFWVNDALVCSNGKVGTRKDLMTPEWRPQAVSIKVTDSVLRIIFQISNFQNTRGGSSGLIRMSKGNRLVERNLQHHLSGQILVGIFTLVGIVGAVFFFILRRPTILYFALLTLAFTIRFFFSDLYLFYDFNLSVPWKVVVRVEYVSIPFIIIWGTLFIFSQYPSEFRRSVYIILIVINSILVAVVGMINTSLLSELLLIMQIVALCFLSYVIYIIVKALLYERVGAWASAAGVLIFSLVGFYNVAALLSVIELNRVVIHVGYSVALLLNALALFYRTPTNIEAEDKNILRFSDLYNEADQGKWK